MPDLTLCTNVKCPSAMICYRFTALTKEENQSYTFMAPRPGESSCDGFIEARITSPTRPSPADSS